MPARLRLLLPVLAVVVSAACAASPSDTEQTAPVVAAETGAAHEDLAGATTTEAPAPEPATETPEPEPVEETATAPDPRFTRPEWLGTRPLTLRPDGLGQILPTPDELADRQLATPVHLPAPPDDSFHSTIIEVPGDVAARSTWDPACPVGLHALRYVTLSFWGFDGGHHTGELLVHRDAAGPIVDVFRRLHEARFPIEEMRVTRAEELDLHPTGDGNNTGAFVCRPSVGSTSWSEHAYGLAIDINPFHNPLLKGDLVVPELASAYVDRAHVRPGMIVEGDVVTQAFDAIGWAWGGRWSSAKDWMHFSASGR